MLSVTIGILLGNLLIAVLLAPALGKLRDLLDKLAHIELPHGNNFRNVLTAEQRHHAEDAAAEEFNKLYREYNISYGSFKRIGLIFVLAIIALICTALWQIPFTMGIRELAMASSVGTMLAIAFFLKGTVAPTPLQLVSIDFLQNHFTNLYLESLFNCSHLCVNFVRKLAMRDPVMHFAFTQRFFFTGYRFLLAVTDPGCSRLYFASYGQLDSSADLQHYWTPNTKAFVTSLGEFSFSDAFRQSNSLCLHLWLFIPTPRGWLKGGAEHPRFLSEELTTKIGDQIGVPLCSSDCSWGSVDTEVDFDRRSFPGFSSWVISRINVPRHGSPQAVLRRFKNKIEHCKGISSEDLPFGRTIAG